MCASTTALLVDAHAHHSEDMDSRYQSACSRQDGPVKDLQQRTGSMETKMRSCDQQHGGSTLRCTHPDLRRARWDLQRSFNCAGHCLISEYLETTNV